ncbi:acyl-CoA dehydrogenase family protein [Pseudomonas beijingensis]|uniref:acyl-CoA dehydrogenase family protein n=1 Tax=Pseudomonas beijingensis TaxID=2954101 RepID=UPI002732BAC3|nr:acyl-CoA dehydrogenase family protein [Pseudomonas sp. FP2262]WLH48982.1 acyl-CoA dehydrogenase family protein [Pseudomonas sp. FP2262]
MNSQNHFDVRGAGEHTPINIKAITLDDVIAEIVERRSEFNQLSHVPLDMIEKMKTVGIFRASTPKCFGGDALAPGEFLRIVERISEADGSVGWVTAFGSANIYLASLPPATQDLIYANGPDQVYAGGLYPLQPAKEIENGWEVSGRWRFASGCKGADWIGVGIGGTPANGGGAAAGKPLTAVFPAGEVQIVDNWNVVGMQGTGSHDLKLHKKTVGREWTFVRGSASTIDEPLYRYPSVSYQAQVHAAVNLGLARAALDMVIAMSGSTKTVTGAPRLGDRAYYRSELGKAEAMLRSAQAFFYETADAVWASLLAGNPVTLHQANLLRLSATHAAHTCAEVVMKAYRLAGTAAIFKENRLQWIVRDSMVVTQHAFLGESTYDGAGALFAGIEPTMPYP